ncbi:MULTISPECIES: hypothetical protein [unclassified Mesorhizobium]|uniref:hypothetical protein n=1 Tax=unclassified Mesorhizobium TaxID=325217 RepID=UPI001FDF68F0|nr:MULTISPECIES: hypothetical protein [unclassified Mesorhizobium]
MRPHLDRLGISNSFCVPYPVLSPRWGTRCGTNLRGPAETAWRPLRLPSRTIPLRSAEPRSAVSRVEHVLSWLCRLRGR